MSITIIDGEKQKRMRLLDQFLERAYERQKAEKEVSDSLRQKRERLVDRVLHNDRLRGEEKEKIIQGIQQGPMPLKKDMKKKIKVVSSGSEGYEQAKRLMQNIHVEEIKVDIEEGKIKQVTHRIKKW